MTKAAQILLQRAAMATLGGRTFFRSPPEPGAGGGGGGGGKQDPEPKKDDPAAKDDPKSEPKKIELTEEELEKQIQARLDKIEAKRKRDEEEKQKAAEAEKAKKAGEYEKLYTSEVEARKADQQARDAAELKARRVEVVDLLREHVATKHPEYLGVVRQYMAPLLSIDSKEITDADALKQIEKIAADYVRDNPRSGGSARAGLPGATSRADELRRKAQQGGGGTKVEGSVTVGAEDGHGYFE